MSVEICPECDRPILDKGYPQQAPETLSYIHELAPEAGGGRAVVDWCEKGAEDNPQLWPGAEEWEGPEK